tara:strand:- start:434 stop:817 length:384 start_codon:yes stop_codon:yes gene_type:complete
MNTILLSGTIMLLLVYFLAGLKKIKYFGMTASGLKEKLPMLKKLPLVFFKFLIFCTISIELAGPLMILFGQLYSTFEIYSQISIIALIVFTLIASFIYHFPSIKKEQTNFLKNLGLIGGLLVLYNNF